MILSDNKVVFCTGGAGTICSAQVRALVHLGANACIVGRNVEKTEIMAKDIATARSGAKVLGLGSVDVRRPESLNEAAAKCAEELGGIDFVMYIAPMLARPRQVGIVYAGTMANSPIVPAPQAISSLQ